MADLTRFLGRLFAAAGYRSPWLRYALAVVLPCVALALTSTFARVSHAPFFPLFSLAVIIVSVAGGVRPGLLSTALSILLNILAVPPAFSFRMSAPQDVVRVIAFGVVSTIVALLIGTAGEIQRRLDVERRRLDVTLRSIGDAVIATTVEGHITFMNGAAEQATGWTYAQAAGLPLEHVFQIVNERTRNIVENPVTKVLRLGRVVGLANHTILIRKDGSEIPIDDSAAPIVNAGVLAGVVLVFRDVTEARLGEAALLKAEKLASVGRLAATIAHEINNPLEAVMNLLYLIKSTDDIAAVKGLAEAADQELARAAHVTQQTLSFARQSGNSGHAEVAAVVDTTVTLYASKLNAKDISVLKRYRGEGSAKASRHEVGQVLSNLLSNAIDAERQGGRIDIRVHSSPVQNTVRLTVADHGCGMTREQMARLYEPFFTTKQDVGTGLGLWVTKEIVDVCGGRIAVRSRPGRGTVFSVSWPLATTTESKVAAAQE